MKFTTLALMAGLLGSGQGQEISLENGVSGLRKHQPRNMVDLNCPVILDEHKRVRDCEAIEISYSGEYESNKFANLNQQYSDLHCDDIPSLYPQNYRCGAAYEDNYDAFQEKYAQSELEYGRLCHEKAQRHWNLEDCKLIAKYPQYKEYLKACSEYHYSQNYYFSRVIPYPCRNKVEEFATFPWMLNPKKTNY